MTVCEIKSVFGLPVYKIPIFAHRTEDGRK